MFSDPTPRHFISFSASDQRTVRDAVGLYDGILVPGTIATYQREGTAGFILTLSAREVQPPYVIDPRFPLFQQKLRKPKESHKALAEFFRDPALIARDHLPSPDHFSGPRIAALGKAWVKFNTGYREEQSTKFQKYADRLREPLYIENAQKPQRILAPYFCVKGVEDPWWPKSQQLYDAAKEAAGSGPEVTRVISAETPSGLLELIDDGHADDVCIWVSDLDEYNTSAEGLAQYCHAVAALSAQGRRSFALYGGFFAIMLSALGLGGLSHGIGYGDHRNWRELPRSGPPPARYYLPTAHRYVLQDDANRLWSHDPALVGLGEAGSPNLLDFQALRLHSVTSRAAEVDMFRSLNLSATIEQLEQQRDDFLRRLHSNRPNRVVLRLETRCTAHLTTWIKALRSLL